MQYTVASAHTIVLQVRTWFWLSAAGVCQSLLQHPWVDSSVDAGSVLHSRVKIQFTFLGIIYYTALPCGCVICYTQHTLSRNVRSWKGFRGLWCLAWGSTRHPLFCDRGCDLGSTLPQNRALFCPDEWPVPCSIYLPRRCRREIQFIYRAAAGAWQFVD